MLILQRLQLPIPIAHPFLTLSSQQVPTRYLFLCKRKSDGDLGFCTSQNERHVRGSKGGRIHRSHGGWHTVMIIIELRVDNEGGFGKGVEGVLETVVRNLG